MRKPEQYGLCLGMALALVAAAPYAIADDETPKLKPLPAMQIQIDAATGRKTLNDDADAGTQALATRSTSAQSASANALSAAMPSRSSATTIAADGTLSVDLGLEHMKFLVMSIDDEGERQLSHQPITETALEDAANTTKGEEE